MSNGTGFDPKKLSGATKKVTPPAPRRLYVDIKSYETPSDGFAYAVGHVIGKEDEQVRVRLTTVSERVGDKAASNSPLSAATVEAQYATSATPRDTLGAKAKDNIRFISFDEAYKIGEKDGVTEYRAHWPTTMAVDPAAEVISGIAHIHLSDAIEPKGDERRVKAKAYVEMVQAGSKVDGNNIDEALFAALARQDEHGRARDPRAIVRVLHDDKLAATLRIYPQMIESERFDGNLGRNVPQYEKADAANTIADILNGTPGFSDYYTETKDIVRAIVAGLKGEPEPVVVSADEAVKERVSNFYHGTAGGHLKVEVIAAKNLDFGKDSGVTYLGKKHQPHLAAYTIEEAGPNDTARRTAGYVETVVAVLRHPDGEPYVIFAGSEKQWAKRDMAKLSAISVERLPELVAGAELEHVASADKAEPAAPVQEGAEQDESRYDDGPSMD